jgi:two-component system chemotaxis response regulator CheY
MRVLIVDDSKTMRRVITNCLSEFENVTIHEAGNGAEAMLRLGETNGADLIFSDWNMPVQNGLQFLHALSTSPFSACPVIMVTSEADKSKIVEAVSAGARSYVIKPFSAETLRKKVKDVLAAQLAAQSPVPPAAAK